MLTKIWKPDTVLYNGKKSYLHTITQPNRFVRWSCWRITTEQLFIVPDFFLTGGSCSPSEWPWRLPAWWTWGSTRWTTSSVLSWLDHVRDPHDKFEKAIVASRNVQETLLVANSYSLAHSLSHSLILSVSNQLWQHFHFVCYLKQLNLPLDSI